MLWSQEKTISGTVTDNEGTPLPGVNIVIEGTSKGFDTDFDGNFTVFAKKGNVLIFSYVGMLTQKRTIGNNSTITIKMQEDSNTLEEVVVIGYGSQQKTSLTGSVATISAAKIEKQAVIQTSQALQGLSPGLTAIQSSGQPGADGASLQVRGIGSIGNSSNPLIIID